jgi:hypothetical protein
MRSFADMRKTVRDEISVSREGRSVVMSIPGTDGWRITLTDRQARALYSCLQMQGLGDKDADLLRRLVKDLVDAGSKVSQLEGRISRMDGERYADAEMIQKIRGILDPEEGDDE